MFKMIGWIDSAEIFKILTLSLHTLQDCSGNRHVALNFSFYAPNFEEVEGAYWFGPVRLSV